MNSIEILNGETDKPEEDILNLEMNLDIKIKLLKKLKLKKIIFTEKFLILICLIVSSLILTFEVNNNIDFLSLNSRDFQIIETSFENLIFDMLMINIPFIVIFGVHIENEITEFLNLYKKQIKLLYEKGVSLFKLAKKVAIYITFKIFIFCLSIFVLLTIIKSYIFPKLPQIISNLDDLSIFYSLVFSLGIHSIFFLVFSIIILIENLIIIRKTISSYSKTHYTEKLEEELTSKLELDEISIRRQKFINLRKNVLKLIYFLIPLILIFVIQNQGIELWGYIILYVLLDFILISFIFFLPIFIIDIVFPKLTKIVNQIISGLFIFLSKFKSFSISIYYRLISITNSSFNKKKVKIISFIISVLMITNVFMSVTNDKSKNLDLLEWDQYKVRMDLNLYYSLNYSGDFYDKLLNLDELTSYVQIEYGIISESTSHIDQFHDYQFAMIDFQNYIEMIKYSDLFKVEFSSRYRSLEQMFESGDIDNKSIFISRAFSRSKGLNTGDNLVLYNYNIPTEYKIAGIIDYGPMLFVDQVPINTHIVFPQFSTNISNLSNVMLIQNSTFFLNFNKSSQVNRSYLENYFSIYNEMIRVIKFKSENESSNIPFVLTYFKSQILVLYLSLSISTFLFVRDYFNFRSKEGKIFNNFGVRVKVQKSLNFIELNLVFLSILSVGLIIGTILSWILYKLSLIVIWMQIGTDYLTGFFDFFNSLESSRYWDLTVFGNYVPIVFNMDKNLLSITIVSTAVLVFSIIILNLNSKGEQICQKFH